MLKYITYVLCIYKLYDNPRYHDHDHFKWGTILSVIRPEITTFTCWSDVQTAATYLPLAL